ncbi:quinone-dependent dihydroorotate dehydrogenase [Schaalia sp. lx-260]|uniref:quinone-dependent dihydroorotate dehydrogenase n=1 Tax=Schaalia sp. lx-260 TaxID=2899082 RepID=UPI001E5F7DCF|nr:quinone-dependent dihydroorotate dehydrogenase [Schaalia sp. lx-260]MCD4549509.1 quinone-dependent dihydroorotate dehydrogenase [Schaalia sp. lx-260]
MLSAAYSWLFRTFIHKTDPEYAHHHGLGAIGYAGKLLPTRRLMRATLGYMPTHKRQAGRVITIGNRIVSGRLGLAAGMDKNAQAVLGMTALGFAFVEIGTITPQPQPGNEAPRLWRLMDHHGLRNRMGFNNEGAHAAAQRLRELRSTREGRQAIVGANIGKNKITPEEDAAQDYQTCARILSPWVDFIVVNVSSPNTPGLRNLQAVEHLRPIVEATQHGCTEGTTRDIPIFVKIAPDLDDEDIIAIAQLTRQMHLAGVVATNTTIAHDLGDGGVSGKPLKERALEVVRLLALHLSDDQILIGTGGIFTPDDALDMLACGADLVEAFTAFVFQGPSWPGMMNRALAHY